MLGPREEARLRTLVHPVVTAGRVYAWEVLSSLGVVWLSHVPPGRLPGFWNTVAAMLAPGGKAIFIDDGPAEAAREEVLVDQPVPAVLRRLDDGSQYRIVKVFHDARTLTGDLTALGWSARVRPVEGNWIVGIAEPPTNVNRATVA